MIYSTSYLLGDAAERAERRRKEPSGDACASVVTGSMCTVEYSTVCLQLVAWSLSSQCWAAHDRPCSDSTSVQCVCRDDVTRLADMLCQVRRAVLPPAWRTPRILCLHHIMWRYGVLNYVGLKTCLIIFKILSGTSLIMDLLWTKKLN